MGAVRLGCRHRGAGNRDPTGKRVAWRGVDSRPSAHSLSRRLVPGRKSKYESLMPAPCKFTTSSMRQCNISSFVPCARLRGGSRCGVRADRQRSIVGLGRLRYRILFGPQQLPSTECQRLLALSRRPRGRTPPHHTSSLHQPKHQPRPFILSRLHL